MNRTLLRLLAKGIFLFSFLSVTAQARYTVNGYIKDGSSGETLIGANIFLENEPTIGTVSNTYGFYSITIPEGNYRLIFSYLGFQNHVETINLTQNLDVNVNLSPGIAMEEVVVEAKSEEEDDNVESTSMGRVNLPIEQIKIIPALLGEIDILKVIQLLPGVSSAGEGSAGFYVRGGGADQNLVLLDEAVVYNSGH
ncbi:MAG: carboxypeptidase-like regulatory domain-containing protein, partial [Bacteroidota bacterium]|nr:carboxypeptidase-like regulatory domain-containing protein [Bacteroidota bacterium]